MPEVGTRSSPGPRAGRAIVAATLLGALLRFFDLGGHPLWLDENATFIDIHTLFGRGPDSPVFVQGSNLLYYTLLWGWAQIFGESEAALRSLSALAATACIPFAALLARRFGGDRAAVVCAVLVAVHPLHIHYAREARGYALWTLLLLVAIAALWRAATSNNTRAWATAALAWLLAFGAHVFTAFALPVTAAAILWADDRARASRSWLAFAATTGSTMLVYAVVVLAPSLGEGTGVWLEGTFEPLGAIAQSLWALLPSGDYPLHIHSLSLDSMKSRPWVSDWVAMLAALVPIILVTLGLVILSTRQTSAAHADWRPLAALALGPLLLQWIVSWGTPVYFVARYDMIAWPAWIVWIALGIASLGVANSRRGTLVVALLVACAAVPSIRALRYTGGEGRHRERGHAISHATRPGDLVITFSDDDDLLAHSLSQNGFEADLRTFPGWLARQIAFLDTRRDLSPERTEDLARDAAQLQAQVEATLARGARVVWVNDSESHVARSPRAPLFERLAAQFASAGIERIPFDTHSELYVLEKRQASEPSLPPPK